MGEIWGGGVGGGGKREQPGRYREIQLRCS